MTDKTKRSMILDLRARPGANLRRLLEVRKLDQGDFAMASEMAKTPTDDPEELRRRARSNLRAYTHGPPRFAAPEMVVRWAMILGVDVSAFFVVPGSTPTTIYPSWWADSSQYDWIRKCLDESLGAFEVGEARTRFNTKIRNFSDGLDERGADIVLCRIASDEPENLASIGHRWGVSKQRASQVESNVIARLGAYLRPVKS